MAVTKGHGNPNWSRDEVILALDLYFDFDGHVPGPSDKKVQALSRLLRSIPANVLAAEKPSFRNPDGVAFKLQNLRQVATGKGLGNTSKTDREVWKTLGGNQRLTKLIAYRIRAAIENHEPPPDAEDDLEFPEGATATRTHLRRERNPKLRKAFLKQRQSRGALSCDLCRRDSASFSKSLGDAVFECHHIRPLSEGSERVTKVTDLALLCASCHKIIHRAIASSESWVSIDDARKLISE